MTDKRPNILFIMTDDHAAHALSCYGSKVNTTPNMDRISTEGRQGLVRTVPDGMEPGSDVEGGGGRLAMRASGLAPVAHGPEECLGSAQDLPVTDVSGHSNRVPE